MWTKITPFPYALACYCAELGRYYPPSILTAEPLTPVQCDRLVNSTTFIGMVTIGDWLVELSCYASLAPRLDLASSPGLPRLFVAALDSPGYPPSSNVYIVALMAPWLSISLSPAVWVVCAWRNFLIFGLTTMTPSLWSHSSMEAHCREQLMTQCHKVSSVEITHGSYVQMGAYSEGYNKPFLQPWHYICIAFLIFIFVFLRSEAGPRPPFDLPVLSGGSDTSPHCLQTGKSAQVNEVVMCLSCMVACC